MNLIKRNLRWHKWREPGARPESPYVITIYNIISEVPEDWDKVTKGHSLFLSREYLELLEMHGPLNLLTRYALVMRSGLPVATVKATIFNVDDDMLSVRDRTDFNAQQRRFGRFLDKGMTWLRNRLLGTFGRRMVFCGNLFSCGLHGVAFAEGENPENLWPIVIDALNQIRHADGQATYMLIKDIMHHDVHHRRSLVDHGFSRLQIEPSMDLYLPAAWRTHSDYISSLNAKYRKTVRKIYEAVNCFGALVESGIDPQSEKENLFDLYMQVEHHAQIRFGTLQVGYLPALAKMAGTLRSRCSVIRKENRIVGFSMVVKDGNTAIAHLVGFDYEANRQAPIYLRLLHQVIEDGLTLGCSMIHYGRTALEPKARLGATPTHTEIWVKHCQPIANFFVGRLLQIVPEDTAPHRKPFRLEKPPLPYNEQER